MMGVASLGCMAAPADDDSTGTSEAAQSGHRWKTLNIQYEVQHTPFWCGPASTRIALSARIHPPHQAGLAWDLGTTIAGTDYIGQVTGVLNRYLGPGTYETRTLPNDPITPWEKDRLWRDIVASIDNNFPLVANIVAPPHNHPPGYPNSTIYHYFTIIGYNPDNRQVFVADPGFFGGNAFYWLSFDQLASLIPPKGYSTWIQKGTRCPGGEGLVHGAIEGKFLSIGGCGSPLGAPLTNEERTPDGVGRYNVFQNGSIYWTEATGAHVVQGVVRDRWRDTGWEGGPLGYPTTDELGTPDGVGRYSEFQRGVIYYTPKTGALDVYGTIYRKWAELGREQSPLGYPTSTEYGVPGGRQSDFEHGWITWDAATNVATVTMADQE
ncbi:MAG TPA: C39 family peptidase [Labilithrix sp.]|nr:C39 family peptidase [Labilithrix sp.]